MKKVLSILGFLLFNYYLFAQDITVVDRSKPVSKVIIPTSSWVSCENGMYYYEEYGDLTKSEKSVLTKNIGIGLFNPVYKLHAAGDIYADGGWLRASGSKGLYFQSYGGGLYMNDATWIRTYGNKSFYHNTGTMRTDGTFQVGPSGDRFIVNTSGNVGIATIAPVEKLQVEGNIRLLNDCGYIKKVKGLYFGWASSMELNLIMEYFQPMEQHIQMILH